MKWWRELLMLLVLIGPASAVAQNSDTRSNETGRNESGSNASASAQAADDQSAQRSANRFVVGVLVDARVVRVDSEDRFHRLIKLENREGRELIVDLGASPPPEAIGLREGDLVVALGKSARINGHPVLYALYVAPLTELAQIRRSEERESRGTVGER